MAEQSKGPAFCFLNYYYSSMFFFSPPSPIANFLLFRRFAWTNYHVIIYVAEFARRHRPATRKVFGRSTESTMEFVAQSSGPREPGFTLKPGEVDTGVRDDNPRRQSFLQTDHCLSTA